MSNINVDGKEGHDTNNNHNDLFYDNGHENTNSDVESEDIIDNGQGHKYNLRA